MTQEQIIVESLSQISGFLQFLLPIIGITAVIKILFDNLHNFLFNITSKRG